LIILHQFSKYDRLHKQLLAIQIGYLSQKTVEAIDLFYRGVFVKRRYEVMGLKVEVDMREKANGH
jgi:hypothetical protein